MERIIPRGRVHLEMLTELDAAIARIRVARHSGTLTDREDYLAEKAMRALLKIVEGE